MNCQPSIFVNMLSDTGGNIIGTISNTRRFTTREFCEVGRRKLVASYAWCVHVSARHVCFCESVMCGSCVCKNANKEYFIASALMVQRLDILYVASRYNA